MLQKKNMNLKLAKKKNRYLSVCKEIHELPSFMVKPQKKKKKNHGNLSKV